MPGIDIVSRLSVPDLVDGMYISPDDAKKLILAIDLKIADTEFTAEIIRELVSSMVEEMGDSDWLIDDGILPNDLQAKLEKARQVLE